MSIVGTDSEDGHYQQMHLLWIHLRFGSVHFAVADVIKGLSLIRVVLQSSKCSSHLTGSCTYMLTL